MSLKFDLLKCIEMLYPILCVTPLSFIPIFTSKNKEISENLCRNLFRDNIYFNINIIEVIFYFFFFLIYFHFLIFENLINFEIKEYEFFLKIIIATDIFLITISPMIIIRCLILNSHKEI